MPIVWVAVAPAMALLVNTTVPATVVPTCEFIGKMMYVVTSANKAVTTADALLLLKLLSGTVMLPTTADTIAPAVVTGTVTV